MTPCSEASSDGVAIGNRHEPSILLLFFPECCSTLCLHQFQNLLPRNHAATVRPRPILLGHVADALGMLRGQVMHLGAVGIHVIEFPWARIFAHELPFADAHRGVAFMFPEHRTSTAVTRCK